MFRRHLFSWTCTVLLAALLPPSLVRGQTNPAGESHRALVLYVPKPVYDATRIRLVASLRAAGISVEEALVEVGAEGGEPSVPDEAARFKPDIVVAAGPQLTDLALRSFPDAPVVFFTVPNAYDLAALGEDAAARSRLCGVSSDASPGDQVRWIRRTMPEARTVALLHGARTQRTVEMLREAAASHGITIIPIHADRTSFLAGLETIDTRMCDGVLMIPDADVYTAPTVQRLLLWGIRRQHPVWTFSERLVEAGAFAGLAPRPETIADETALLVRRVLAGVSPGTLGVCHASPVEYSVNLRTAELIGREISANARRDAKSLYGDQ